MLQWIHSGDLDVDWALRVDTLTAVMLVVVTTVSALVHLYSLGLHGRRTREPAALLRLSVPVHLRDADAGDGGQPRADVLRLGRRRPRLLPADRLLVPQAERQRRGDQGVRRQPRRRFRLHARHLRHLPGVRHGLDPGDPRRGARHGGRDDRLPRLPRRHDDGAVHPAVHRRDGQVGAARPAHLAARRDGRPDAGLGADPRRDDGDRGRVHGLPPVADVRDQRRPR